MMWQGVSVATLRLLRVSLMAAPLLILPGRTLLAKQPVDARPAGIASPGHDGGTASGPAGTSPKSAAGLRSDVFEMALGAASCAVRSGAVAKPGTLTVIDYSKPSTEERLWVFALPSHELLYSELVAHGQGSGGNVATMFSNESDTHRSSLGLFLTADTFVGKIGYGLRLIGLEPGFNDHALERGIVMHGAWYVSAAFAKAHGYLGRSWGCPTLRLDIARQLMDRVKGGGLLFAYYPDPKWLKTSKYLGHCSAAQ
jgi:hypothetical protein